MSNILPIVFAPFPFLDKVGTKNRPLLVLSESVLGNTKVYITAYITTKKSNGLDEFDILLQPSATNGLECESVIKLNKLGSVDISTITNEIGHIPEELTLFIKSKLKTLFNL